MTLLSKKAQVAAAHARVRLARAEVGASTDTLLGRVQTYPLTSVGIAAGAGVLLAQMNFHPLRVPGVSGLLSGGMLELVTQGIRLFADAGFGDADPS